MVAPTVTKLFRFPQTNFRSNWAGYLKEKKYLYPNNFQNWFFYHDMLWPCCTRSGELNFWKNWLNWPLPGLQDLVHDDWPGLFNGGVLVPDNSGYAQIFQIFFLYLVKRLTHIAWYQFEKSFSIIIKWEVITPPHWLHSSPESQYSHFGGHQDHTHGIILEQYIINTICGAGKKEFRTPKKSPVSYMVQDKS